MIQTEIQEIDGKLFATLEGELDTAAALEAEKALEPLFHAEGRDVVIECEKLEYIASSGLRILLSILKAAKASGSQVTLRNMNDDIKSVFTMTGLINLFHVE